MPNAGSQIILCDVPVRFDTYKGCAHACSYCFVSRKKDIAKIENGESAEALRKWIEGKRKEDTNWCDWAIPLHWGGMSDPFQPIERAHKRSLEALKVFAETGYPFIVSTKSSLIAKEPYLSLIKRCNCVVQFSACSPRYDRMEKGASPFAERLAAAREIAKCKRVNLRIQPYLPAIFKDIMQEIPQFAAAGVHGIILEAMKYQKPVVEKLVPMGTDYCYPISVLEPQFRAIRSACHKYGLKFYSGENRLRSMSDSLCCCGVEGMGWKVNTANLNHFLFDPENFKFTEKMKEAGTAEVFSAKEQSTIAAIERKGKSYADKMLEAARSPYPYLSGQSMFDEKESRKLREYLVSVKNESGLKNSQIEKHLGTFMARHYFSTSQWRFPTEEAYNKLRQIMPRLLPYSSVGKVIIGRSLESQHIYIVNIKDNK